MKFTCVVVNKKLVWSKGVPVKKVIVNHNITPTPVQDPTKTPPSPTTPPTPTPVPAQLPTPVTLPVSQNGAITFSNIVDHVGEIPKAAWQNVNTLISQNTVPTISLKVLMGPHTTYSPDVSGLVNSTLRLNFGFNQPKNIVAFFYTFQDIDWAKTQFATEFPNFSRNADGYINGGCGAPDTKVCNGANASMIDDMTAVMDFGISANELNDPYFSSGSVVAHEFTHTVQGAQWANTYKTISDVPNGALGNTAPCWLIEGQANFDGIATANQSESSYVTVRNQQSQGHPSHTFLDYSSASLKTYLYGQIPNQCRSQGDEYSLGYSIGMLTVEALTAIAGPQAVLALTYQQAQGNDFATAFQKVYGVTWDQASTVLSQVLAAEFAKLPPGKY
jgi:hypothetical protein